MIKTTELDGLKSRLEGILVQQDELKEKHTAVRKNVYSLEEEIKSNLEKNESIEQNISALKSKEVEIAEQYNPLNSVANDLEERINTLDREIKLDAIIEQQTSFWDALKVRIAAKHRDIQELTSDFVTLKDPEQVLNDIRGVVEGEAFNIDAVTLRTGQARYQVAITELAERKLDGKGITITEAQAPITAIDNFLELPVVSKIWQV
ncbi:MAG: hypothetical protein CBD16_02410 [Betaproteobacteria bacterium TMED156]|nr:MAG: hypothetical protein CBD16_02410 [Betaproteobacteria bacterium TMED156]|tara:strand:+ start:505 stop:1122 length:618 start_codon:yes stop_codon:yes gene_type:complete